jgi:hypothetical protein
VLRSPDQGRRHLPLTTAQEAKGGSDLKPSLAMCKESKLGGGFQTLRAAALSWGRL